jgi:hypothetical protein
MTKNIGSTERVIRGLVGVALILAFFLNSDGQYSWLYLLGIVPLGTAFVGWCPPYALLGINTCKTGK